MEGLSLDLKQYIRKQEANIIRGRDVHDAAIGTFSIYICELKSNYVLQSNLILCMLLESSEM